MSFRNFFGTLPLGKGRVTPCSRWRILAELQICAVEEMLIVDFEDSVMTRQSQRRSVLCARGILDQSPGNVVRQHTGLAPVVLILGRMAGVLALRETGQFRRSRSSSGSLTRKGSLLNSTLRP